MIIYFFHLKLAKLLFR